MVASIVVVFGVVGEATGGVVPGGGTASTTAGTAVVLRDAVGAEPDGVPADSWVVVVVVLDVAVLVSASVVAVLKSASVVAGAGGEKAVVAVRGGARPRSGSRTVIRSSPASSCGP